MNLTEKELKMIKCWKEGCWMYEELNFGCNVCDLSDDCGALSNKLGLEEIK